MCRKNQTTPLGHDRLGRTDVHDRIQGVLSGVIEPFPRQDTCLCTMRGDCVVWKRGRRRPFGRSDGGVNVRCPVDGLYCGTVLLDRCLGLELQDDDTAENGGKEREEDGFVGHSAVLRVGK